MPMLSFFPVLRSSLMSQLVGNTLSPSLVPIGIDAETRREHPAKAPSPISSTLSGMVTETIPAHPLNAPSPMERMLPESESLRILEHPSKAESSMMVVPYGMVTEVSPAHFSKAFMRILLTVAGISSSPVTLFGARTTSVTSES